MRWVLLDFALLVATWPLHLAGWNPSVGIVVSKSMVPYADVGDLILSHNYTEIREGDVVLFDHRGSTIVHRVVVARGNRFVTRGDANAFDDRALYGPYLRRDQIRAKVLYTFPSAFRPIGKAVTRFMKTKWLLALYATLYVVDLTDQMQRWIRN